jgi:hypothetical protein
MAARASGAAGRRVSLHMSVSLDGFVARGDGVIDWLSPRVTGLSLMHGLPDPQRFELVSSTAYADGRVSQVLLPA